MLVAIGQTAGPERKHAKSHVRMSRSGVPQFAPEICLVLLLVATVALWYFMRLGTESEATQRWVSLPM
eukprot:s359_g28.t1